MPFSRQLHSPSKDTSFQNALSLYAAKRLCISGHYRRYTNVVFSFCFLPLFLLLDCRSAEAEGPGSVGDVPLLCQESWLGVAAYELPELSESLHWRDWVHCVHQQLCQVSRRSVVSLVYVCQSRYLKENEVISSKKKVCQYRFSNWLWKCLNVSVRALS